jgi:hypothetical protein
MIISLSLLREPEYTLTRCRPQIQRTTTAVNSYLTSLNIFINGGRKHAVEPKKTDSGKVLKSKQGVDELRYNDITIQPHADTIKNLHPFPIAPYPNTNDHLAGLAQTLLRKRLEPTEEKWIEDRLAKALEFASVPPEWGIEPKKPADQVAKENDSENDEEIGGALGRYSKRTQGTLTEDQLVQRWNSAHMWFFNPPQMQEGDGEGEEDYASGEEGSEEEEFEDAMNTPLPDESSARPAPQEAEPEKPTAPPPPVVMVQEAEPPVHKPVPGMPVLELGLIQRFMATGAF